MGNTIKVKVTHLTNEFGVMLELVEFPPSTDKPASFRSTNVPGLSHVALTVSDLDGFMDALVKSEVTVIQGVTEVAEAMVRTAWIRDVENNAIELVEPVVPEF